VYTQLPAFVRHEANRSMLHFVSFGATLMLLAGAMGGEAGWDPTSSDFGKIKIGNTRVDVFGGYQQPVRLIWQLMAGKVTSSSTGKVTYLNEGWNAKTMGDIILQYVSYKEAPVVSLLTDYLSKPKYGRYSFNKPNEFLQDQFDVDVPDWLVQRFTYMFLQDMYDAVSEDPKNWPIGLLGIFGIGVQTY